MAEVVAVLRYRSLHTDMGDMRSMLSEVLRMSGNSMSSTLQQTWEAATLSMALKQRASLCFAQGQPLWQRMGSGWHKPQTI